MERHRITYFRGPSRAGKRPGVKLSWVEGLLAPKRPQDLMAIISGIVDTAPELAPLLENLKPLCLSADNISIMDVAGTLGTVLQDNRYEMPLRYSVATEPGTDDPFVFIDCNEIRIIQEIAPFAAHMADVLFELPLDGRISKADVSKIVEDLRQTIERREDTRYKEETHLLVEVARELDIPVRPVFEEGNLLILGHGHKRQRMFQWLADTTSAIGINYLQHDKHVTFRMFRDSGIPCPSQRRVTSKAVLDKAVKEFGFPLVIKGATGARGETVTANIRTHKGIAEALEKIKPYGQTPVIETFVEGEDYRLTVINGRLESATRRVPARVTGDGKNTIETLIDIENKRREGLNRYAYVFKPIKLDDDSLLVLSNAGFTPSSVPDKGQIVRLRSIASLSQGGFAEDATDEIHPTTRALAERAARLIGLDIAGLDLLTTDITKPLSETGGAFIEINGLPGLCAQYATTPQRKTGHAVFEFLFPDGDNGRIPIAVVTGTRGSTDTAHLLNTLIHFSGYETAGCTAEYSSIGRTPVSTTNCATGKHAEQLLQDPKVTAGVFEFSYEGLEKIGTRLDKWAVGIITALEAAPAGWLDDSIERVHAHLSLIAELAEKGVVLNADDATCRALATKLEVPVWWFGSSPAKTAANDDCHYIFFRQEEEALAVIWLAKGAETTILRVPDTGDQARRFLQNALAAVAGALAFEIAPGVVGRELQRCLRAKTKPQRGLSRKGM